MSIYIKDEETCRLADELARLTGETVTDAIAAAIRERLERAKHARSIEERVRKLRSGPSAVEHEDFLCAENGLPGQKSIGLRSWRLVG